MTITTVFATQKLGCIIFYWIRSAPGGTVRLLDYFTLMSIDAYYAILLILLSSDIRSEGSIAIVKIYDLDFLMIFYSTSLPESKNVF